jgi:hypothetical protein
MTINLYLSAFFSCFSYCWVFSFLFLGRKILEITAVHLFARLFLEKTQDFLSNVLACVGHSMTNLAIEKEIGE